MAMQPPLMPNVDIGRAPGVDNPVLRDPQEEYVVGGTWGMFATNGGIILANAYDEIVRRFGPEIYEYMGRNTAIACATWLLKAGAVSEGIQISPAIKDIPGDTTSQKTKRADIKLVSEIHDSCERQVRDNEQDINQAFWELADSVARGCSAAEQVFSLQDEGEDAGRPYALSYPVQAQLGVGVSL